MFFTCIFTEYKIKYVKIMKNWLGQLDYAIYRMFGYILTKNQNRENVRKFLTIPDSFPKKTCCLYKFI